LFICHIIGSLPKARGEGICPRLKAEMQHIIGKWVIAWSKRERKA
jgi:hypothetical protein